MPSSMWRPAGPGSQTSGRLTSWRSGPATVEKTPTRLIQPPRLVETATSGAAVTIRPPISGSRASAARVSPNACWVLVAAAIRMSGTAITGALAGEIGRRGAS